MELPSAVELGRPRREFQPLVDGMAAILSAAIFAFLSPITASMLHNGSTIAILLRALAGAGLPDKPRARRKHAALH